MNTDPHQKKTVLFWSIATLLTSYIKFYLYNPNTIDQLYITQKEFVFMYSTFFLYSVSCISPYFSNIFSCRYASRKDIVNKHIVSIIKLSCVYSLLYYILSVCCHISGPILFNYNALIKLIVGFFLLFLTSSLLGLLTVTLTYSDLAYPNIPAGVLAWSISTFELLFISKAIPYLNVPRINLLFSWLFSEQHSKSCAILLTICIALYYINLSCCNKGEWF